MVALTGIEPAGYQFSSVQLGLSSCVFGLVQFATRAFRAVRMADVLPRCCPAARIRLLTPQPTTSTRFGNVCWWGNARESNYGRTIRGRCARKLAAGNGSN